MEVALPHKPLTLLTRLTMLTVLTMISLLSLLSLLTMLSLLTLLAQVTPLTLLPPLTLHRGISAYIYCNMFRALMWYGNMNYGPLSKIRSGWMDRYPWYAVKTTKAPAVLKKQKSFGEVHLNGTARAELQVPHKVLKCQKFYHLWREMSDLSELQLLKSLDAPPWIYKLHLRKQMQTQRHLRSPSNTTLQRQIQRLLGSLANNTLRTNSRK